ncbi:NAD(P)-binding protein [Calocera viscosa TUFC12733]|uniref:NAD(P)-binding protein n=1 Tax=Calocera viscosa (strain TUFC12733) TaxID=1330018 RepID=A0A167QPD1_CALVF|nr:NAD(P)-binding protein [Calocera viscosa TUFC12733]
MPVGVDTHMPASCPAPLPARDTKPCAIRDRPTSLLAQARVRTRKALRGYAAPLPPPDCRSHPPVALNKRDHWIALNAYPNLKDGSVLGSDGVGVLTALAPSASSLQNLLNKRVVILPSVAWGPGGKRIQGPAFRVLGCQGDNGTFAEYVDVLEENVLPAPEALDDVHAAALPLAGLTAWRAVKTRGGVERGMNVLVTAAGSGVSTFAMQFAVALGARVWTTSSSKDKIDFVVKTIGVEGGVNYKDKDWTSQLAKLVGGSSERVIDVVIDGTGSLEECIKLLRPGGRYVFYGNTSQQAHTLAAQDMRTLYWLQADIRGSTMGSPEEFAELLDFVQEHKLQPVVSSVRPFTAEGWKAALGEIEKGDQQGKIVLKMQ